MGYYSKDQKSKIQQMLADLILQRPDAPSKKDAATIAATIFSQLEKDATLPLQARDGLKGLGIEDWNPPRTNPIKELKPISESASQLFHAVRALDFEVIEQVTSLYPDFENDIYRLQGSLDHIASTIDSLDGRLKKPDGRKKNDTLFIYTNAVINAFNAARGATSQGKQKSTHERQQIVKLFNDLLVAAKPKGLGVQSDVSLRKYAQRHFAKARANKQ